MEPAARGSQVGGLMCRFHYVGAWSMEGMKAEVNRTLAEGAGDSFGSCLRGTRVSGIYTRERGLDRNLGELRMLLLPVPHFWGVWVHTAKHGRCNGHRKRRNQCVTIETRRTHCIM
ncbi:hypothetical protein FKM82_012771 [Ascaphus truei]